MKVNVNALGCALLIQDSDICTREFLSWY